MTKVDYMLTGCANGHPVRIDGKGTVGRPGLRLAFTATEAPRTFDATLAHFAGIDAVAALADGLAVPDDAPVAWRATFDDAGRDRVLAATRGAYARV